MTESKTKEYGTVNKNTWRTQNKRHDTKKQLDTKRGAERGNMCHLALL